MKVNITGILSSIIFSVKLSQRKIIPSNEIQLADLSSLGSGKDSPEPLPLAEIALENEVGEGFEALSRNSSQHSDASVRTPPPSLPASDRRPPVQQRLLIMQ